MKRKKKRQGEPRPASLESDPVITVGVDGAIKDTFEIGEVPKIPTATITCDDIKRHIDAFKAERRKIN